MKKITLSIIVIGFLSACSNDDFESDTREFEPGKVSVGIKSGTEINELFDFINLFNHQVDNVNSLTFTSDLPSDNLQLILDNLNEKTYTNDGVNWFVTGYLHHETNDITIFPRLFGMDNIEYQTDWLNTMDELDLNEKHNAELNSGIVRFYVPVGKEREWRNRFTNYDIVDWAELEYIGGFEPNMN